MNLPEKYLCNYCGWWFPRASMRGELREACRRCWLEINDLPA